MAQVHRSRKDKLLARFGLKGSRVPLVAGGVVVVVLFCLVAFVGMGLGGGGGVELKRAAPETVAATTGVAETGAAVTDKADVASADTSAATTASTPACIYVHVDGAVASPGVYELTGATVRANDAVRAAGGLTSEADTSRINLAAVLADGDKLYVPAQGEDVPQGGSGEAAEGGATGGSSADAMPSVVNINTATAAELDALPGVGPSTAAAIVEDREANGAFATPEDLMRVSGIGEKKFAKLKAYICV